MLLWVGCMAGALDEGDYRAKLAAAGFEAISVEPTRVYKVEIAPMPGIPEFQSGRNLREDVLDHSG